MVRANVNENSSQRNNNANAAKQNSSSAGDNEDQKKEMIEECVKEVMHRIKMMKER